MGTSKRRRQLAAGAWVIGLLCLATLVMALVSKPDDQAEVALWIVLVVFAVAVGAFGVLSLLRGTQKGRPLAFEPFRWQLITTALVAAAAATAVAWQLLTDSRDLLSVAYFPLLVGGLIGQMYRPEGTRAEWLGTGRRRSTKT
jgi:hypothetical protein